MRFLFACAVLLASFPALAKSPRLTLFITVDALSSDLYLRSKGRFKSGLATLSNSGAVFPTARYEHAETVTAAGHATLATGAHPWRHGIVGNSVFNRQNGKAEAIFADPSHPVLDAPPATEDSSTVALLANSTKN
jgi:predicted AlkP superfamily pyrophosphatase or phosphodiesterase